MSEHDERATEDRGQIIREFSDVLDRISRLLIQVTTDELTTNYGLSLLQMHALETLWRVGPEMEMSSLAASTSLPASSLTSIVDRLVTLGLAERRHSETDRRRVLARITPAGKEVMTRIDAWGMGLFEQILRTSDTADIDTCLRVFIAAEQLTRDTIDIRRTSTRPA